MNAIPFDVVGPEIVVALGLGVGVGFGLLLLVVLLEAIVLRAMRWGNFWRSLLAALVMNVVSSIVGVAFVGTVAAGLSAGFLLVAFVLSVAIEAVVLLLMKRGHARQNWLASLAANASSYVPLAALYLLFGNQL